MKSILARVADGWSLGREQANDVFEQIMTGQATAAQIGALLAMIQLRGPTTDELIGAAQVMRSKANPVTVPDGLEVIDTCGTGGDHSGTFNISTAAAIVAAGASRPRGVAVAKHGNRSVTSRSGSSQVLEALGVHLQVTPQTLTRCLDEAGLCFCFAPAHHPAMKYAVPVRQELGFRTIFNLLGPLTNPAGAKRQVIGVFSPDWTEPIAEVLQTLGAEHAMVVHGHHARPQEMASHTTAKQTGLDELTITGKTRVSHLRRGKIHTYNINPVSLGLTTCSPEVLVADGPQASAQMIRSVLQGKTGSARDVVCLNAAAALVVADLANGLEQGLALSYQSVDSGAAAGALDRLIHITQDDRESPDERDH